MELYETNIEKIMREELERRGFRRGIDFATQYPLRYSFILDFAFPKHKLDMEVDGEAWHSSKKAKRYDAFRDRTLKKEGWSVVRFSGQRVLNEVRECVEEVKSLIEKGGVKANGKKRSEEDNE